MTRKLLIQGWFDLPHSYSVVLQNQLTHWISLASEYDIELVFEKMPYYSSSWKSSKHVTDSGPLAKHWDYISQRKWDGCEIDWCYRICFPYDPSPPPNGNAILFLFMTCEFGAIDPDSIIGSSEQLKKGVDAGYLNIITPSHWSAQGLYDYGIPKEKVHVIPHGVDPEIFKIMNVMRRPLVQDFCENNQLTGDPFVFLHIGAMTSNKGITSLIKSFAVLSSKHPNVVLIFKGHKDLYTSSDNYRNSIREAQEELKGIDVQGLSKRILFMDSDLSVNELSQLYNSADCYVTPYLAEGFNIPALEAAACGLPVIATKGGPTDDFLPTESCIFIDSSVETISQTTKKVLHYDWNKLTLAMEQALLSPRLQKRALTIGAAKIRKSYDWTNISRQHLTIFKDSIKE